MKLSVDTFSGIVPRVSARLLAANQAQVAHNARLESGDLEAWPVPVTTASLSRSGAKTIYRYADSYWLEWAGEVDAVRGPISGDVSARIYWTGQDKPRFGDNERLIGAKEPYPSASYVLGIPRPANSPGVALTGTATDDDPALIETRFYRYTYVSKFGEEGPPSPVSSAVDWQPGRSVKLSDFVAPQGEFVIDTIRVYRTAGSGAAESFVYVGDIAATTTAFTDNVKTAALGEILPSDDWIAPPTGLNYLTALPNGVLAGADNLDVCLSEQYLPHAWPRDYRFTTDDPVIGLGAIDNALVVLTRRAPYVVVGGSPAAMSMTKIGSDDFACVAPRGAATVAGLGVVYPTASGLAAITTNGARLITEAYLDRRQWQGYAPTTMRGIAHRGRYFGFYDGGTVVFDPTAGDGALYTLDLDVAGAYRDPATDTLYLIQNGQIMVWDDEATPLRLVYAWRSKAYELPAAHAMTVARVRADDYRDTTLIVYGDGNEVARVPVRGPGAFRLPVRLRSRVYEFVLTGTARIHDVALAENKDGL